MRLREILRQEKILGSFVGTVGRALELSHKDFDLILCSESLPDGSGLSLLEKIRIEQGSIAGTVLLRTSDQQLPHVSMGADAIAERPLQQTLKSAIERALLEHQHRCRRRAPRFSSNAMVEITFSGFGTVHASIANISSGGMFVRIPTDVLPQVGADCHFQLECNRTAVIFGGSGVVRWARSQMDEITQRGIGVEFSQINRSGLDEMLDHLISDLTSTDPA